MLMRGPNKVRAKLAAGQRVLGTAIYSASPNVVEAAGYAGIDFVRIDTEHAWRRDESLEHMIRAAVIADVVPIVRIDRDDPYLPRKALEVGAGGIIVPQITTEAEAREVVRAAKFPPQGERGVGTLCPSGEWGRRKVGEWAHWSNSEPLVGVMIESRDALAQVDRILAVDGIDFALFGPSDYSMSVGSDDAAAVSAAVEEGLRRTIAAAKSARKHVMLGVGLDADGIRRRIDEGVSMLELGHDVVIVRNTLSALVTDFASG
jgi:4-hydroxy-2-oxoheptanedioate aldolase